jgi:hypothetical protein
MQAKELKAGDKFTVWEGEKHTVCLKTEDGHTYRLNDGSEIRLYPTKRVALLPQEEAGFRVADYQGRLVLAKRLAGGPDMTPRYVIKPFIPLESAFVIGPELRGIGETTPAIRTEVNNVPVISPQVLVMLQELEGTLSKGASFLQVIKMLLQMSGGTGAQGDITPIMVNLKQLPTE